MSEVGRKNTMMGIAGLIKSIASIRDGVIRAKADGQIDREEALELFGELAAAIITNGLEIALSAAESRI